MRFLARLLGVTLVALLLDGPRAALVVWVAVWVVFYLTPHVRGVLRLHRRREPRREP